MVPTPNPPDQVARHIRLPYAASATLLSLLVPLVFVCFRETLTREQRVPFRLRPPGLGFVRLFSSPYPSP